MKKLSLIMAAAAVALTANADIYLIGGFNGWELKDAKAKFTEQTDGSYVLDYAGQLTSGFKINDGAWGDKGGLVDLGGSAPLVLGEPYELINGGSNIELKEGAVDNPHIVLNKEMTTLTITGQVGELTTTYDIWGSLADATWASTTLTQKDGKWVNDNVEVKYASAGFGIRKMDNGKQSAWISADGTNAITTAGGTFQCKVEGKNFSIAPGTYSISFDPESLTLVVTGEGGEIVPPPVEPTEKDVYLVGEFNEWTPNDDAYKMTKNGNVYTIKLPNGLTGEWKVCDGTWSWTFGADEPGFIPTSGVECNAWYGSSNNYSSNIEDEVTVTFTLVEGSDVAESGIASKIVVTGGQVVIPPVEPTDKELYLVGGAVGGWTVEDSKPYKMTKDGNVYTITLEDGLKGDWKIWDGTWDYSFGGGALEKDVEADAWFNTSVNFSTRLSGKVTVKFTLVEGSDVVGAEVPSKIIVTGGEVVNPPTPEEIDVYLVGEFNGWTPGDDACKMTRNGNVYTISLNSLEGSFKVCDGTWDWTFGAPEIEYSVEDGVDCDAWYGSSNNFSCSIEGPVIVTFTLVEGSGVTGSSVASTLMVKKDTVNAVEAVEVAEGVAEYYNLQGVKVANPVKGIFVKVVDGKATKVVL